MTPATLTLNLDPFIQLGPVTLAWHGLTIAIGVVVGGLLALRYGRERGLDPELLLTLGMFVVGAGIVGARLFYLAEHGDLLRPGEWLGTFGFSIYGAVILGPLVGAAYARRSGLSLRYLDALAAGFPLGLLVGRVGDLINGEHYGPVSDLPWAVQNSHPDALTPDPDLAYHSGGLYEMALGLTIFLIIWPLRGRFRRPGVLFWTVVALYSAGRFAMFFVRDDSAGAALGLNGAQWTSVALLVAAAGGLWWAKARRSRSSGLTPPTTRPLAGPGAVGGAESP